MATCGTHPDKIRVAYNGCRTIFEPVSEQVQIDTLQQFSEGQPYFFYTGAIHPRKNIPRLIRAFSSFKAATGAPVQLLLGGRFAWHTGEVTDAYNASTYKKDIKILGYINDLDLPRIMGSALALVYPSLSEGFGLPVLEAMQCNVPVLTSNVTALPEVAGDAALLIDPEDETALTTGLIQLWQDAALRNGLVERGKVQRAKFSWDTAADILMDELLFLGNTKNKNA
jgi:glycosyltransferase involved in cell wall biosynthesis